jgi:hypothetical protein
MPPDILEQTPRRTITARRLWQLARRNAVLIPLTHQWNTVQAYRVDAQGGPYLMLTDEVTAYRAKCLANPDPTLIAHS